MNREAAGLQWRQNAAGMWAWFDGDNQVTGARAQRGADYPYAILDEDGHALEVAAGALPGETVAAYVLRGHGLDPERYVNGNARYPEPPAVEPAIADHPEFSRLVRLYGNLSLAEMDSRAETMHAEALALCGQHVREFNGNGGRRYGAAMSTQAGRELGSERLLLCAFRAARAEELAAGAA